MMIMIPIMISDYDSDYEDPSIRTPEKNKNTKLQREQHKVNPQKM